MRTRASSVRAAASESPATSAMSRRVTPGESIPSPAWTSSIARTISAGGGGLGRQAAAPARRGRGVFDQEAARARLQRGEHELVGVEGGEDDDRGRVGLGGEQAGG